MNSLEEILPSRLFEILDRNGICSIKQIILLSIWDIKKFTNLPTEDIKLLKNIVSEYLMPKCTTCDKLIIQEKYDKKVTTGCLAIDKILKGGFRRGTITEIYGESSSGKTQIGIQTAAYNWHEGCVYICTEDLFPIKRFEQIKNNLPNYDPTVDYGKHIFVEHITEPQDLLSCIRVRLPTLLSRNKICLIVIDSVAAPFRVEYSNYIHRANELRELAILLTNLAQEHNLAILCINQVTAAFKEDFDVMPSLGLAWSNMINSRLWLKKTTTNVKSTEEASVIGESYLRELSVDFAPDLPCSMARVIITQKGIHESS
ncbi:DNA repair protein XRCC3 [Ostrinia furnacalis]|uniref:DNA repair protein XRCC3 n=1 Tax=Ostrinia furnacalis TaxID=93504 RepID=UPI00103E32FC|nr:DNA repair protein XRCC3 [Ostrinia furnacalis]